MSGQTPTTHRPSEIPSNLYKPTAPLEAKVLEHKRLTASDSPNEVTHIVLDISGSDLYYLEGQSIGVLPPGLDENGRPHKLRLYSIASPSVGDDRGGKTVSVCVKRAITVDEETGKVYPGVCSNYLCDLKIGSVVKITGPVGKSFLMPAETNANMIMIATGTGIAPFRAFVDRRYRELDHETGECWVFFGAQTRKDFLYEDEWKQYDAHDTFHLVTAFSREEKNAQGGRMYVQHRLAEHADRLFTLLEEPNTYLYICGLRGMETGILETFQKVAASKNINWDEFYKKLKDQHRWHVEVY